MAGTALAASSVAFGHVGKGHQASPDGPGDGGRERICRAGGGEQTSGCRGLLCQSLGVPVSVPSLPALCVCGRGLERSDDARICLYASGRERLPAKTTARATSGTWHAAVVVVLFECRQVHSG